MRNYLRAIANLIANRPQVTNLPYNLVLSYQLLALLAQNGFAAQLDLVAFERQDLDHYLIAFLQLVAHVLDAVLRNLADVQQTIGAGENLDERAEFHQPHHFPEIRLADFGNSRDVGDPLDCQLGRLAVRRVNLHRTVVFDVDLHAGLVDDAANA